MTITIGKHTTSFCEKSVKKMSLSQFESLCMSLITFKQLPFKKRKKKIKEVYGNIKSNAEKVEQSGFIKNSYASNEQSIRGIYRDKQGAIDDGEEFSREEDNSKVQKQKLRKLQKKKES